MGVYVLGDSHTQALGPRIKTRFPGLAVTYQAFPGHSTRRAHAKATIPWGEQAIVLSLGGNDRGDQSAARAALVAAVKKRNPAARILWFGPFDAEEHATAGPAHNEQAEAQRRQLPGLGVTWVDTRPFSRSGHRGDNVHFTMATYSRIADAMKSHISRIMSAASAAPAAAAGGGLLVIGALALGWMLLRRR